MSRKIRGHMLERIARRFVFRVMIFSLFWTAAAVSAVAGEETETAVIVSSEIRPYLSALEGLRAELDVQMSVYSLQSNPELVRRRLADEDFDLVISIGPEASKVVWETPGWQRLRMALMVLDPVKLLDDPHLCGVDLRIPMQEQIRAIAQRFGTGRTVGILYNPQDNEEWVERARSAGSDLGITVTPLPVAGRKDVPRTLGAAFGAIDTLLFIPDATVISETLVAHLVKEALLQGIAVIGYNHFFVEAGAVMALSIDYKEVGILGARLAREILANGNCRLHAPPYKIEWNEKAWKLVIKGRETRTGTAGAEKQ